MPLAPLTSAAEGGYLVITASPNRGEEEHDPKGEGRRGVAVPPVATKVRGQFDGFGKAQDLSTIA